MTSDIKQTATYILIAIVFITISGYTLFQLRHLINGPKIALINTETGSLVHDPVFPIKGVAANIKGIAINDRPAFIDEQGQFADTILLSEGYNVITISGQDRFNRKTERQIEVMYQEPARESASATTSKRVATTNSNKTYPETN